MRPLPPWHPILEMGVARPRPVAQWEGKVTLLEVSKAPNLRTVKSRSGERAFSLPFVFVDVSVAQAGPREIIHDWNLGCAGCWGVSILSKMPTHSVV